MGLFLHRFVGPMVLVLKVIPEVCSWRDSEGAHTGVLNYPGYIKIYDKNGNLVFARISWTYATTVKLYYRKNQDDTKETEEKNIVEEDGGC